MRVAGPVAGICVIRDAFDIVPFLCGHYLRLGVERVHFIDDGSSDGTFEYLNRLSLITNRISVQRVFNERNRQPELYTEGCNALIESGYSIIVPFDSDEFWNVEASELERRFSADPETVFTGQWINFVQSRECWVPQTFGLMRMAYRAPALFVDSGEAMASVVGGSCSFVCISVRKIGIKTTDKVSLLRGQHALAEGPAAHTNSDYEIFHLPFRYRSEISKRALNYETRNMRASSNESWQGLFHRRKVLEGQTDALWAANSADKRGFLNVNGKQIALTRDYRLRRCLASAAMYLLRLTKGRWRSV